MLDTGPANFYLTLFAVQNRTTFCVDLHFLGSVEPKFSFVFLGPGLIFATASKAASFWSMSVIPS